MKRFFYWNQGKSIACVISNKTNWKLSRNDWKWYRIAFCISSILCWIINILPNSKNRMWILSFHTEFDAIDRCYPADSISLTQFGLLHFFLYRRDCINVSFLCTNVIVIQKMPSCKHRMDEKQCANIYSWLPTHIWTSLLRTRNTDQSRNMKLMVGRDAM